MANTGVSGKVIIYKGTAAGIPDIKMQVTALCY